MLNDEIKYDWLSKDNWISVNDRLPDYDVDVLVWDGFFMSVMWVDRNENKFKSMDSLYHNVDYWMPLPEPPNDSE